MDFAIYNKTDGREIQGDLYLSPATQDLAVEQMSDRVLLQRIIEHFDLAPADDIDYPAMTTAQRRATGGDSRADLIARARDARLTLRKYPGIDPDSIECSYVDDRLRIEFATANGTRYEVSTP